MPSFHFRAASRDGGVLTGTIAAADRQAAFRELDSRKLQALALEELVSGSGPARSSIKQSLAEAVRLKPRDVLHLTEELAELLRSGVPLEPALGMIEKRESGGRMAEAARMIRAQLREGASLSGSLRATSPDFGPLYCGLVAVGEESGALAKVLQRQALHLKSTQDLKSRVVSALIYPAFLATSALAVSILFVTFLIPKLMDLLESTGGTLPWGAQIMVSLGSFVKSTWFVWLGLLLAMGIAARVLATRRPLQRDRLMMGLPLLGKILRGRQCVQFLETMSTLAVNGMPVTKGLALTANAIASPLFKQEIERLGAGVAEGKPLSACMAQSPVFPVLLSDLVAIGEQTGDLPGALTRAAARFDADLNRRLERTGALVQPAVVMIMAGIVGAMAYLMISAIFQTMSGLSG